MSKLARQVVAAGAATHSKTITYSKTATLIDHHRHIISRRSLIQQPLLIIAL
jgi:hypothetical protein